MRKPDPLNAKLDLPTIRSKDSVVDATVELADTLDICWAACRSVFGSKAQPEHAVALVPLLMSGIASKRQQLRDGIHAQSMGAASPRAAKKGKRPGESGG